MAHDQAYLAAEKKIQQALQSGATELDLSGMKLTDLPDSLGQLTQLTKLDLSSNQLTTLPPSLGQLTQLQTLNLRMNNLAILSEFLGPIESLKQLKSLNISFNKLIALPTSLGNLAQLADLQLDYNKLTGLPESLGQLKSLETLRLGFASGGNPLEKFPDMIRLLSVLKVLMMDSCQVTTLPEWINELAELQELYLEGNNLTDLPFSISQLEHLKKLDLSKNPLNPAMQSAYDACERGKNYEPLFAYLRSLEQNAEPLYEAKLVLVGEGKAGKTTLLKALKGMKGEDAPKQGESKTHGVEIDIQALRLPHPAKDGVQIQLNAWDFGGQDVYRVTHQFFFSRRSLYLLVWEPRRNVQQAQVEDWLNMIRLRVGDEARVLVVSTYCKTGESLARIDKPVLQQQYGEMIVGFYEVDSLVPDKKTGEMAGIAELKKVIAEESAKLEQMGMLFNNNWKAARDELIAHEEPRISYTAFGAICATHGLSQIDTDTLAHLMHDLGYIVHYSEDEKLREDVVLKPQWLTKAIGFVLEDRVTLEAEGILPDQHLYEVWHDHQFKEEPRYDPDLYPFFLRLMEKYDVSYRLPDGKASLVAQHVPQVRPALPWLPEQEPPKDLRRIAMICAMEEDPPGLVPWMIVRTHDYAVEQGKHHLHWQKGMFLDHGPHGEAMLVLEKRDFRLYAQADWPEYFMNVLQHTLQKLITDNWPGLEGRYSFMVPCPEVVNGQSCKGRFKIQALRQFLVEGDTTVRCQECSCRLSIAELLFGFEERDMSIQLREIKEQLAGMDSRIANYFMATLRAIADEGKFGPRLFTLRAADAGLSPKQLFAQPMEVKLWCEAEGCQHPVYEKGMGVYKIDRPHEWVPKIAPYASFALKVLSTVAPIAGPAINAFFGPKTTENWGIDRQLDLANAIIGKLPADWKVEEHSAMRAGVLSEPERSGILALHALINQQDPNQERLGLYRIATYTGDYRWLCKQHYEAWQSNIPDVIR